MIAPLAVFRAVWGPQTQAFSHSGLWKSGSSPSWQECQYYDEKSSPCPSAEQDGKSHGLLETQTDLQPLGTEGEAGGCRVSGRPWRRQDAPLAPAQQQHGCLCLAFAVVTSSLLASRQDRLICASRPRAPTLHRGGGLREIPHSVVRRLAASPAHVPRPLPGWAVQVPWPVTH